MKQEKQRIDLEQGTQEWLDFRRSKIGASDAPVIMGVSPWKKPLELYKEKIGEAESFRKTERMQRGINLEPLAREAFILEHGINIQPAVYVKDWALASLDGISDDEKVVVEIKCPNMIDHEMALQGNVPAHYYPQLQHQMYVCDVESMYYYSFDGNKGHTVLVKRDEYYIEDMISKELSFYKCILDHIPPPSSFVTRSDSEWEHLADAWKNLKHTIDDLLDLKEILSAKIVEAAGELNSQGHGIVVKKIVKPGNIDYASIPSIKGIDLSKYRRPTSVYWRIDTQS